MHNGRRRKLNILAGVNRFHRGNSMKNKPFGLFIPNTKRIKIQEKTLKYENQNPPSLRVLVIIYTQDK